MRVHAITVSAFAAFAVATTASAGVITTNDLPNGTNNAAFNIDGVNVTVSAFGGNFIQNISAFTNATGITGGSVDNEIDGEEYLLFTFDTPVHINTLSIAYLYIAGNHGDVWNEIAAFDTTAGNFTFTAFTDITAQWDGFGTYVNQSPAVEGGGGSWLIFGQDIFGGPITSLVLRSGNPGETLEYADFGFRYVEFTPIPEPGSLALLALAALSGYSRRRR